MESRILEIRVDGAEKLPNVRRSGRRMKVFTEVSIPGYPDIKKKTAVDKTGGSNPTWNYQMKFTINKDILPIILFEIYCVCFAGRKRPIGEVRVPVRELAGKSSVQICRYPVTPVGKVKGASTGQAELIFTYIFQEKGHVPGKKRDFLKTVAARIGLTCAVAAFAACI